MLSVAALQDIARQVRIAQDEQSQLEPFTSRMDGFDLPSAYAVAQLVHEARVSAGAVPVGRKIGFTNPDMWSVYGVHEPIWAYVYDTTVTHVTTDSLTISVSRYAEPKLEPELAFHLRTAPPQGGDLRAILDSIDWIAHTYEIVQSHFPAWRFQAADTIADASLHGALFVGEPQFIEHLASDPIAALQTFNLSHSCNGIVREVGKGSNVLGSPLLALAHLIKVLSSQSQSSPLQAGEIVTTGTITAAETARAGDVWQTTLTGLPLRGLTMKFVP
jgi:2-oxo-3-hexenedioate decarboxylase